MKIHKMKRDSIDKHKSDNKNSNLSVAIFDFDKTITSKHTFIRFLRFISGTPRFVCVVISLLPNIVKYKLGKLDLMVLREKAIAKFYTGLDYNKYKQLCKKFTEEHLNEWLVDEAIQKIRWHKLRQHKLILLSNSPEDYLEIWASQFGFDNVFGSKFEFKDGKGTGNIIGKHCFGKEKVNRLKEEIPNIEDYYIYGYGDSTADKAFLDISNEKYYKHFNLKNKYSNKCEAFKYWNKKSHILKEEDVRLSVLRYATLAPNTHNIQPWKIKLDKDNGIYIYIDKERLLRYTDPDLRHVFMSHGTFIETFKIAAAHFKYKCDITLLPKGTPSIANPDELPTAHISLQKDPLIHTSPLFDFVTKRHTSHAIFSNKNIPEIDKTTLLNVNPFKQKGYEFLLVDSQSTMSKISKVLIKAMKIQSFTAGSHAETIKMIRFRKKELYLKKDGFSFRDLGVKGLKLWLAENFASPRTANSFIFKKNAVKSIGKMANSAKAYGIIYTTTDSRESQILSGQIFCLTYLMSTKLGLAFQPMDHVFQKYKELTEIEREMCDLVKYDNKIPMIIFRIGYSTNSHHTPRRPISDLLIK